MRVVGKKHLATVPGENRDVRSALAVWEREVEEATWASQSELKSRYPKASLVGRNHVVFDIKENQCRLHIRVHYEKGLVLIVRLGNHEAYDNWVF